MRFLIIVKASPESEAGALPEDDLIAQMATYHEELAQAGALLDSAGLLPSSAGWPDPLRRRDPHRRAGTVRRHRAAGRR